MTKEMGLLVLRLGIGAMFVHHGTPKIFGGPELWERLGLAMGHLGISFLPLFWGFMAAVAEFFGGLLLVTGFFTRPAAAMMAFTMLVASIHHLKSGDGINGASHAIELGVVFVGLFLMGPGKYSLDAKYGREKG